MKSRLLLELSVEFSSAVGRDSDYYELSNKEN
jgi:hypothetical protein